MLGSVPGNPTHSNQATDGGCGRNAGRASGRRRKRREDKHKLDQPVSVGWRGTRMPRRRRRRRRFQEEEEERRPHQRGKLMPGQKDTR